MRLDERTSRRANVTPAISLKSRRAAITRYAAAATAFHCTNGKDDIHDDTRPPFVRRLCDFGILARGVIATFPATAFVLTNWSELGSSTEANLPRFVKTDSTEACGGRKGTAIDSGGTRHASMGMHRPAYSTAVQANRRPDVTLSRNKLDRSPTPAASTIVRAEETTSCARRIPNPVAVLDSAIKTHLLQPSAILRVRRSNALRSKIALSTIPMTSSSAEPPQKRSIMPFTARTATFCRAAEAS